MQAAERVPEVDMPRRPLVLKADVVARRGVSGGCVFCRRVAPLTDPLSPVGCAPLWVTSLGKL